MRKQVVSAAATLAMAGGLVLIGGSAEAVGSLGLYENQIGATSNTAVFLTGSYSNLRSVPTGNFSDKASGVRNLSDVAWVLYDDAGYKDRRYCIKPGQVISNLHNRAWSFGDKISSVKKLGTSSCSGYPTF